MSATPLPVSCRARTRRCAAGCAFFAALQLAAVGTAVAQPLRDPERRALSGGADSVRSAPERDRPAWLPRYVSIGLGGVAATTPSGSAVNTPAFGGALDVAAIGRLRGGFAWRAEGFLQAQDRRDPPEAPLRRSGQSGEAGDPLAPCLPPGCSLEPSAPAEHSRRTGGLAVGVEHHARPGRTGPYVLATLGLGSTRSYGMSGSTLGVTPSVGIGLLSPLDRDLDGFALEVRWRRIPTAVGAVDTGVLSAALRF